MNSPTFKDATVKYLDPDLADLVQKNLASAAEAILLQTLRVIIKDGQK
jgi:hypothetical protein